MGNRVDIFPEDPDKFKPIIKIEPVTRQQVLSLAAAIGPISSAVVGLNQIDISKGRGVFDDTDDRCLWDKDGRRITIEIISTGGVIASKSKSPDPHCPK